MMSQASLSLSLYLSQKSLTHNKGRASALPIILKEEQLPYMGHIFPLMVFVQIQLSLRQSPSCRRPMGLLPQGNFLEWHLAKFIPTLSNLCHPLRQAIIKEEWNWNQSCDKAVTEIKEAIVKTGVLRYLHSTAKITVQCDASSLGLGAGILQEGKPVAFDSRALSSAEKNYSQLEKEMLAIVFALRMSIFLFRTRRCPFCQSSHCHPDKRKRETIC